jgi:SAM-dependent methyltransferase
MGNEKCEMKNDRAGAGRMTNDESRLVCHGLAMQDILRARYDAVSYHSGAIPDSHPARMGAIGRLHGLPTAAPDRCRVLELGCADGMNLLPMAERFPGSQFVGVDFAKAHIAAADEARAACNLENARFVCADLREFEPEAEGFDYVIAHGVYSWVSDEVKERLLAICARALAPGGMAYVSYNTLPVWGFMDGLREFLLTEMERERDPREQIEHARRVMAALKDSIAGQPGAYPSLVRQSLAAMLQKQPDHLYHDDLAAVNDPRTFMAFTNHAGAHGLHYVAEAHYATMMFEHAPAPMRAALAGLDLDFMRVQQFMDVIFQRFLRNSLLCRAEPPPTRTANPMALKDCVLGLRLRPVESRVNLGPGAAMRMTGPNELSLEFDQPAEKAMLSALAQAAPARAPYWMAFDAANRLLLQAGLPPIDPATDLCGALFRLFTLDALDVGLIGDGEWLKTAQPPAPSALMRYQAQKGSTVVNRWHEPVDLTPGGRQYLTEAPEPSLQPQEGALRAGLLV